MNCGMHRLNIIKMHKMRIVINIDNWGLQVFEIY